MIGEATIRKVRELGIEDVVRPYVDLHRKGTTLMGCCPFHQERTGSFSVSESKGVYYCFSCHRGGDAIGFVMEKESLGFYEAVEHIARKHGIAVDYVDREQGEAERQDALQREALLSAVGVVHQWFAERLRTWMDDETRRAREYAYSRWGEQYCSTFGIGYAPADGSALLDFCRRRCLDLDLLCKAGIMARSERGTVYPLMRGRVTIPIRNLLGREIAFSARTLDPLEKAKYKNSPNSEVFVKKDTVFGLDRAKRVKDACYFNVVEGAPDVMRLQIIGQLNTVATLGTAWSAEQFKVVKRYTDSLCFIPDADPAKGGESFGAGVKAVLKNGAAALRLGFYVTVRELPLLHRPVSVPLMDYEIEELEGKGVQNVPRFRFIGFVDCQSEQKNDPDSFIESADIYNSLEEELFLPWMAKKLFSVANSLAQEKKAVDEVAGLLVCIKDKGLLEDCIRELGRIHGRAKLWRDCLNRAKGEAAQRADEERKKAGKESDLDLLRRFSLGIKDNCFYSYSDETPTRLSNFVMTPLFHIEDNHNGTRIFTMKNYLNEEKLIEFSESELCSLAAFQQRVSSLGNFIWRAKIDKLNSVKEFLYAKTPSAERIQKMGWDVDRELYAFGNGVFIDGVFKPVDEMGFIKDCRGKTYYIPALSVLHSKNPDKYQFERTMVHEDRCALKLCDFARKLEGVFGEQARIGLMFAISAIFRDVIYRRTGHFPLLFMFGEKGSGKTSFAMFLQSLFWHGLEPPQMGLTSIPAMNDTVSQSVNTMVVLDEYKNDLDPRKVSFLKGMWGGAGQKKKNINGDGDAVQTIVTSAVTVCGQDEPKQDMALFMRVLFLHFTTTTSSPEQSRAFDDLKSLCDMGLTHITLDLLRQRGIFEKNFASVYNLIKEELKQTFRDEAINNRILGNWLIPLATFRTLESFIDLPFSYAELHSTVLTLLRRQDEMAAEASEMADFWDALQGLQTAGRCVNGAHFCIKYMNSFRPLGAKEDILFQSSKPVLFLNTQAIIAMLGARGSAAGSGKLFWSSVISYLKTHGSYLGLKQQRFAILAPNGSIDYSYELDVYQRQVKKMKVNRPNALCFDYEMLRQEFNLNLETEIYNEGDPDPDDEPQTAPD